MNLHQSSFTSARPRPTSAPKAVLFDLGPRPHPLEGPRTIEALRQSRATSALAVPNPVEEEPA